MEKINTDTWAETMVLFDWWLMFGPEALVSNERLDRKFDNDVFYFIYKQLSSSDREFCL